MSVRATSWAWETGRALELPQGQRLTLVRIADHADNDGVCWPGQAGLADYCGGGERTIRRHLQAFEGMDLLHRERRGPKNGRGRRADAICLHLDANVQPATVAGYSQTFNRTSGTRSTGHLEHVQPDTGDRPYIEEPSIEPSVEPTPPTPPVELPRVDGERVDADHWRLAEATLGAFNALAGTGYTIAAHFRPIVMRIREHPELSAEEHGEIVAAAFAAPWWEGRPGPEVVYGNAAQFERSIEQGRARRHPPASTEVRLGEGERAAERGEVRL